MTKTENAELCEKCGRSGKDCPTPYFCAIANCANNQISAAEKRGEDGGRASEAAKYKAVVEALKAVNIAATDYANHGNHKDILRIKIYQAELALAALEGK